jgi:activator of HSP90 ATPase
MQYSWSLDTPSSPAVDALYALARARLPTALETKFVEFPIALIDTHGKDLTISADPSRTGTPAPSGSGTPGPGAPGPTNAAAAARKVEEKMKAINTSTVTVEATFMIAAADLFALLTDEKRIPSWTRAPAQVCIQPHTPYFSDGP